jgi:hypothetical protein
MTDAPQWLLDDDLARAMLAQGQDVDSVFAYVERLAIKEHN